MTQPIQAYDIYNNAIYEEIEKISPTTAKLASDEIAKIANLLVKYGFVSLPVWCFRSKTEGCLMKRDDTRDPIVDISTRNDLYNEDYTVEHWKGQMK